MYKRQGSLALMIKRGTDTVIPKGSTRILADDSVILSVPAYHGGNDIRLEEIHIDRRHEWNNKSISELNLPENVLIAMIKRQDQSIIPSGHTVIHENDTVVIYR